MLYQLFMYHWDMPLVGIVRILLWRVQVRFISRFRWNNADFRSQFECCSRRVSANSSGHRHRPSGLGAIEIFSAGRRASQGQAGFSLTAANQSVTTTAGNIVTVGITETATDQNWHTVAFSIAGLPDGVTANFSPNPLMGTGSTTLSLSIGSNAGVGAYTLTITGSEAATATSQSITIT